MHDRLNKIAVIILLTVFLFSLLTEFNILRNNVYSLLLRFCFLPIMFIIIVIKGCHNYFKKK